jgi:hypothetical protein
MRNVVNMLCGQNANYFVVKAGSAYSNHCNCIGLNIEECLVLTLKPRPMFRLNYKEFLIMT